MTSNRHHSITSSASSLLDLFKQSDTFEEFIANCAVQNITDDDVARAFEAACSLSSSKSNILRSDLIGLYRSIFDSFDLTADKELEALTKSDSRLHDLFNTLDYKYVIDNSKPLDIFDLHSFRGSTGWGEIPTMTLLCMSKRMPYSISDYTHALHAFANVLSSHCQQAVSQVHSFTSKWTALVQHLHKSCSQDLAAKLSTKLCLTYVDFKRVLLECNDIDEYNTDNFAGFSDPFFFENLFSSIGGQFDIAAQVLCASSLLKQDPALYLTSDIWKDIYYDQTAATMRIPSPYSLQWSVRFSDFRKELATACLNSDSAPNAYYYYYPLPNTQLHLPYSVTMTAISQPTRGTSRPIAKFPGPRVH